ncbi:hypothetical protein PMALA_048430, partial [Plasmodium malariae]
YAKSVLKAKDMLIYSVKWLKINGLDYIPSDFERLFNENMTFYNKIVTSKLMNCNEKKKHEWDSYSCRLCEVNCWIAGLKNYYLEIQIFI